MGFVPKFKEQKSGSDVGSSKLGGNRCEGKSYNTPPLKVKQASRHSASIKIIQSPLKHYVDL